MSSVEASVVIPAHDEAHRLRRCLDPVLAIAADRDWEVLVVDDGSTDDTCELATALGARTVRRERAGGVAAARNAGAAEARGDVLVFVDADVVAPPETLSRLVEVLAADPRVAATGACPSLSELTPGLGPRLVGLRACMPFLVDEPADIVGFSSFQSECGAIRRSVFEELGGFSERFAGVGMEEFHLGHQLEAADRLNVLLADAFYEHHYKPLLPRCRELLNRTSRWVPLLLRRRRFESTGAVGTPGEAASCALSWVIAGSAVTGLAVPLVWPVAGGAAVTQLVIERRFFGLARQTYGPATMLAAWPALQALHLSTGAGFLLGLVRLAGARPAASDDVGRPS